jgi:hypothetical protein
MLWRQATASRGADITKTLQSSVVDWDDFRVKMNTSRMMIISKAPPFWPRACPTETD